MEIKTKDPSSLSLHLKWMFFVKIVLHFKGTLKKIRKQNLWVSDPFSILSDLPLDKVTLTVLYQTPNYGSDLIHLQRN